MWPGTPRDMRLVRAYCRGRDICEGAGAVWDAAGSGMSGTARTLPPCACSRTSIFPPAGRPGSWGFCGRLRVRLLLGEVRVGVGVVGAAGGGGELEVAGPGLGEGPAGELLDLVVGAAPARLPPRPPHQAGPRLDTHPTQPRPPDMDHPQREHLHHRPHQLPRLTAVIRDGAPPDAVSQAPSTYRR